MTSVWDEPLAEYVSIAAREQQFTSGDSGATAKQFELFLVHRDDEAGNVWIFRSEVLHEVRDAMASAQATYSVPLSEVSDDGTLSVWQSPPWINALCAGLAAFFSLLLVLLWRYWPEPAASNGDEVYFSYARSQTAGAAEADPRSPIAEQASGGFTVAVTLFEQQATDPAAIRSTEAVYLALLDGLKSIPSLVLAEDEWRAYGDMEPPAYDVRLDPVGSDTGVSWRFRVRGRASDGRGFSPGLEARLGDSVDVAEAAAGLVQDLREHLFPADAAMIAGLDAQFHDQSLTIGARLTALGTLVRVAGRSGDGAAAAAVLDGVVPLAAASTDPLERRQIWSALREMNDARLIQPLTDALLRDPSEHVRLQATETLAEYADDAVGSRRRDAAQR